MTIEDREQSSKENEIEQNSELIKKTVDQCFGQITDFRRLNSIKYKLVDIIFITLCAVLCGADDLDAVAVYAQEKKGWLKSFLNLENVPSYTTFWWAFVLLKPEELECCFIQWVQSVIALKTGRHISVDGKALRGTSNPNKPNSFVHMVSAWASNSNFTLGQVKVDGKSNEITAIPKLLDMIDIEGAVVTIDAMGCQTAIAEKIIDNGGHYVLALKENQPGLYDEIVNYFNQVEDDDLENAACKVFEANNELEKENHGRVEERKVYATSAIDFLLEKNKWKNLRSIACVDSKRIVKGHTSREKRYYISCLPPDPERLGNLIRSHWGIENKVHWILDVAFQEDQLKAKTGHIAENLAVIRHMALNLLKRDKSGKASIVKKRFKAALNESYLTELLNGLLGSEG